MSDVRTGTDKTVRLAYVTDLALTPAGGGSYAVNWNAYNQIASRFDASYYGPLLPREPLIARMVSKFRRRVLGLPGRFTYFSERTLAGNAEMVERAVPAGADGVVFRSAARWSKATSRVPYYVYLDAVFHTFFHNTFDESHFQRGDLERIYEAEARFLENARGVFFESRWGMSKARDAYSLRGSHYLTVGRGGVISPPDSDKWDGESLRLVTLAMDFEQKGGDVVLGAYRLLKPRFPSLSWSIIGGEPRHDWKLDGVTYEGVLRPDNEGDRRRLESILENAFLLVHPTREDTSPLVITEAAYFGCPAVSVNAFAIPEIVLNGQTGILVNSVTAEGVASAIAELIETPLRYRDMRLNARTNALAQSDWTTVGRRMCDFIASTIK